MSRTAFRHCCCSSVKKQTSAPTGQPTPRNRQNFLDFGSVGHGVGRGRDSREAFRSFGFPPPTAYTPRTKLHSCEFSYGRLPSFHTHKKKIFWSVNTSLSVTCHPSKPKALTKPLGCGFSGTGGDYTCAAVERDVEDDPGRNSYPGWGAFDTIAPSVGDPDYCFRVYTDLWRGFLISGVVRTLRHSMCCRLWYGYPVSYLVPNASDRFFFLTACRHYSSTCRTMTTGEFPSRSIFFFRALFFFFSYLQLSSLLLNGLNGDRPGFLPRRPNRSIFDDLILPKRCCQ